MLIEALATTFLRRHLRRRMALWPGAPLSRPSPPPGPCLLYVHIPFCEHLCPFCSFHRVRYEPQRAKRYFAALREDIRTWHRRGYRFTDVYVGGGTPTVLPGELEPTLALLRELFPLRNVSVETNPNHLREDVLSMLREQGVNRLSVGVQSFDDALLREMGRLEAYGSGEEMVERLGLALGRFATLNIDLLFNLPHQEPGSLARDLRIVTERLRVDQVSYYPLMSTPSSLRALTRSMGRPTPAREAVLYRQVLDGLSPSYNLSSPWCFNRQSAVLDEYIVDHLDFAGAGSGTFSYLGGTLYASTFSIDHYRQLVGQGHSPLVAGLPLTTRERCRYALLMGLFGVRLNKARLRERCGEGAFDTLRWELLALKRAGIVEEDLQQLRLTGRGLYCWVALMREFFVGVNGLRDRMRAGARSGADMPDAPGPG